MQILTRKTSVARCDNDRLFTIRRREKPECNSSGSFAFLEDLKSDIQIHLVRIHDIHVRCLDLAGLDLVIVFRPGTLPDGPDPVSVGLDIDAFVLRILIDLESNVTDRPGSEGLDTGVSELVLIRCEFNSFISLKVIRVRNSKVHFRFLLE